MKMNKKRPILRRAAIPAVLALLCTLFWFGKPNDFGLGRNMELLVNMMRELSLFYVDEVDPDQLMQDAAPSSSGSRSFSKMKSESPRPGNGSRSKVFAGA